MRSMTTQVGVHHRRVRADLVGQAVGDLRAEVEDDDTLRERQQEMHVVLDQEHGDATRGDAADDLGEPCALARREARRRLVEQDEARLAGERARDFEQPPLPERERGDAGIAQLAQADELHQLFSALPAAGLVAARGAEDDRPQGRAKARMRADQHVVDHGHAGERPVVLEGSHHAARSDAVRRQAEDRLAGEAHLAARRRIGAGDDVEGGRLAGAVRADHAEDLAFVDLEVERRHGSEPAEALRQLLDLENRSHMPIKPPGWKRIAATTSTPNTSAWWCPTSGESQNGSRNSSVAPITAPAWRPAPPTITMKSSRNALSMPKIGGFTVLSTNAYTMPATPAPIAAAASGLSRTARHARPNHERSRRTSTA